MKSRLTASGCTIRPCGGPCSRTSGPASCRRLASRSRPPETKLLEEWIKSQVFEIDPGDPDPGRVTVRRLNRTEYRNTIRDLTGVDYDTGAEFPPDDTGHGFDNIGDVLTLSPLLLEKYILAAKAIVSSAVPTSSRIVADTVLPGRRFRHASSSSSSGPVAGRDMEPGPLSLSYYEPASVSTAFQAEHDGRYQLVLDLTATERYVDGVFDYNKCRLTFKADGQKLLEQEFSRQEGRAYHSTTTATGSRAPRADVRDQAADTAETQGPVACDPDQLRDGPRPARGAVLGPARRITRGSSRGTFPRAWPSAGQYARELLGQFATRAFRRPVETTMVRAGSPPWPRGSTPSRGRTFEAGIAQAMAAVLCVAPVSLPRGGDRAGLDGSISR